MSLFYADKNLGPCILERRTYTKRVLSDHLSDQETYSQLNKEEALDRVKAVKQLFADFVADHSDTISDFDRKFLKQSLDVSDPLPTSTSLPKYTRNHGLPAPLFPTAAAIPKALAGG